MWRAAGTGSLGNTTRRHREREMLRFATARVSADERSMMENGTGRARAGKPSARPTVCKSCTARGARGRVAAYPWLWSTKSIGGDERRVAERRVDPQDVCGRQPHTTCSEWGGKSSGCLLLLLTLGCSFWQLFAFHVPRGAGA